MRIPVLKAFRRSVSQLGDRALNFYEHALTPYWTAQARRRRADHVGSYVALSGSCGKTTTTMLISRLVGAQRSTATSYFANTARWTLRGMRKLDHAVDFFIQEVSEYPAGTLTTIGQAMQPDAVVITAIGLDHFTAFRSRENVATELASLVACLGPGGVVCLNADDELARGLASSFTGRAVLYGRSANAELRAEAVAPHLPGRLSFDLVVGDHRRHVQTRFAGTLMLDNILAASSPRWRSFTPSASISTAPSLILQPSSRSRTA